MVFKTVMVFKTSSLQNVSLNRLSTRTKAMLV